MQTGLRPRYSPALCALETGLGSGPAVHAEWSGSVGPGVQVDGTLEMALGGFGNWSTNFGIGRFDPDTGAPEGDPTYGEAYIEPAVDFSREFDAYGELYGKVSTVAALTVGDSDPVGFSSGGDGRIGLEAANLGWRTGNCQDSAQRPVFDLSVGPQEFDVGDGFLIDDGNFDAGDDGATWLLPRQAFRRAFVPNLYAARDGMVTYSIRANDLRWPSRPEFAVYGEYVRQTGAGDDGDFDAEAWYAEAGYNFATLSWSPTLSYRYAYFSGDADPTTARGSSSNPSSTVSTNAAGARGSRARSGGLYLFTANQRNHYVHLSASPTDAWSVGLLGLRYELAEPNFFGTPVSKRHFGDEFNAYADRSVTDRLLLSLAYGVMFPGKAAVEAFGDDQAFHTLEGAAYFSF